MAGISQETKAQVARAWQDLLVTVAEGGIIGDCCARYGLTRHDVRHYRMQDAAAERDWQLAREQSADECADRVLEIANNPPLDAARARVQMDAWRWLAAKRNPRIYSDKSTVDLNVRTVDLTRIISDANARLAASRAAGRIIEGEIIRAVLPARSAEDEARELADLL